jgi:hypothetical protein
MSLNTAVYWDMTSYRVVEDYHHGRAIGCPHLWATQSEIFFSQHEGSIFLQNLPAYVALYPKNCTLNIHCHENPDLKFLLCSLTRMLFMFHSTIQ